MRERKYGCHGEDPGSGGSLLVSVSVRVAVCTCKRVKSFLKSKYNHTLSSFESASVVNDRKASQPVRFYSSQVFCVSQIGETSKHCYLPTARIRLRNTGSECRNEKVSVRPCSEYRKCWLAVRFIGVLVRGVA